LKPSVTSISRTAVREPARRQGVNARKQAGLRREQRRENLHRTGGLLTRLTRTWGAVLVLLMLLGVGVFFLHRQAAAKGWIALRSVRCSGCSLTSPEELARRANLWQGTDLTSLRISDVEARLMADPRVLSASVRRAWPHGVVLTVTEDVPQVRDMRGRAFGTSGRCLGPTPSGLVLPLLEPGAISGQDLSRLLTGLDSLHRQNPALWKSLRSLRPVSDGMQASVAGLPTELLLPLDEPGQALRRATWLYAQLGETATRLASMDLRHAPYAVLVPTGRTGS